MKEIRRLFFTSALVLLYAGGSQAGPVVTPTYVPHPVIVNPHPVIINSHPTGGMNVNSHPMWHHGQTPHEKPHTHLPPQVLQGTAQVAGNCGTYAKAKQCDAHWNGQRCTCGN
jgi:hypothetical protein